MTLRLHLLRLVVAIALPLLLFAGFAIYLFGDREDHAVERGLRDTAEAFALALDREVAASVSTLRGLATSERLERGDLEGFYEEAKRVRSAHEMWHTVFLVDVSGQEIFSLLAPFGAPVPDIAADPDFQQARRNARPYVSDVLIGPLSRVPVVRVYVPVTVHGAVRYLLAATLPTKHITELLTRQPMSQELVATVMDRAGTIAGTRNAGASIGQRVPGEVFAHTRARNDGFFTSTAFAPGRHDVAFSHVPDTGLVVTVGVRRSMASTVSFWAVASGTLVALAAALVFAFVMATRITRPFLGLAVAARAFGRGEKIRDGERSAIEEVEIVRTAFAEAVALARERALEREHRLAADVARREAEAAARTLEAANRAKDEFLAMLAHELRNPLGAISNAIHVLSRLGTVDDRGARSRDIITRQVRHLARLVDDLLDVSRVVAGKITLARRRLDVAEVVQHSLESLRTAGWLKAHRLDVEARSAWIDGDEVRIEQVVTNLVANALKYTPQGGSVLVRVAPEGDAAVLEVVDTGIGIPPGLLPRIFDLFVQGDQTLDRPHGGLGIGLTLVRRLVELHGGTVEARSPGRGAGSRFTVRLPRALPSPSSRGSSPAAGVPSGCRGRRVLIVEDSLDARTALRHLLEMDGYEVYEAEDGESAIDVALGKMVDVALVDLGLPEIDGYEVARRLRADPRGNDMVLIAVTGYGQAEDRQRTADVGFDEHLVKPVEPERLISALSVERTNR